MLQFASSFTSARFVVQYRNLYDGDFDDVYDNGLARIIDVKGDTVECITLPWLSTTWWTDLCPAQIKVSLISDIASTDPGSDPTIHMNCWVSGGDDIQFAFPRIPLEDDWPYRDSLKSEVFKAIENRKKLIAKKYRKQEKGVPEAQSAIGRLFEGNFPPIAEGCVYDVDQGLCTSESLGEITSLCKRYSRMFPNPGFDTDHFSAEALDYFSHVPVANWIYGTWQSLRLTYFGSWRACFLTRSGGYRARRFPHASQRWVLEDVTVGRSCPGTSYMAPFDEVARLTVPQVMPQAFGFLGVKNQQLDLKTEAETSDSLPFYISARDDVQFGYPILPTGIPLPVAGGEVSEKKASPVKGKPTRS
jgi:hypothetical protein